MDYQDFTGTFKDTSFRSIPLQGYFYLIMRGQLRKFQKVQSNYAITRDSGLVIAQTFKDYENVWLFSQKD